MLRGVGGGMRRAAPLLLVSLVLSACSGDAAVPGTVLQPEPDPHAGVTTTTRESYAGTRPAPEFPDGLDWLNVPAPLSLAAVRGKVVLLDFWTYGCINCIHIIPDLERLEQEYPEELVVIGVHSAKFTNEGETENIRNVVARYGVTHPVVNDRDFAVWNQWGVNAWPTVVLIDPAGNVVGGHSGEGVYEVVQPVLDSLVAEFDARGTLDRTPIDLDAVRPPSTVLSFPGKVIADTEGGRLFVADTNHHRILVVDLESGRVGDVAGSGGRGWVEGSFEEARFDRPQGMALSADGATLYVADVGNHSVRALDLIGRTVTTALGTGEQATLYPPRGGVAPAVAISSPWDLAREGDTLYVAMAGSHQIWALDLASGEAGAVAGSGREGVGDAAALEASLAQPSGLAVAADGVVYFADSESSSIRRLAAGRVELVAGADRSLFDFGLVDGSGSDARFQHPLGVVVAAGALFVADTYNSVIRRIDPATGVTTTFAGTVPGWQDGAEARFDEPGGLTVAGDRLVIADTNNHAIRILDLTTGETSTLVLFGIEEFRAPVEEADTLVLDPVVIAPEAVEIALDVTLPVGYVLNDLAPFSVTWSAIPMVAVLPGAFSAVAPDFPVVLDVGPAGGRLILDLTTYYCTAEAKDLCLIDQVRLAIPLTVAAGGATVVPVRYAVPAPR